MKTIAAAVVCLICIAHTPAAHALDLLQTSGTSSFGGTLGSNSTISATQHPQALSYSFTTTRTYTQLEFFATLRNGTAEDKLVDVFLTTQLGPGTNDTTDLIASNTITISPSPFSEISLLSVAILDPGTYFFTAFGPTDTSQVAWHPFLADATADTVPGLNYGDFLLANPAVAGVNEPYPPASEFGVNNTVIPNARITGIPEPTTAALLGLAGLALLRRRRVA